MTTFIDGPAKGQALMLKRTVKFLRVVEANGQWDALDQLDDFARPDEKLFAYILHDHKGMMHIRRTKGSGFYPIDEYRFVEPQPSDQEMRNLALWDMWCRTRP